jgi:hypothetical protein
VTADGRDHPAMQDQLSATVQAAQRGLAPAADGVKSRIRDFAGQTTCKTKPRKLSSMSMTLRARSTRPPPRSASFPASSSIEA